MLQQCGPRPAAGIVPRAARTPDFGRSPGAGAARRLAVMWGRLRDVAVVALAAAFGMLLLRVGDGMADPAPTIPWQGDAALGAVACLTLFWRRTRTIEVAVAMTVAGSVSAMA